ncbi:MFS transporter [Candidatus Villigracilis affinis]|uniref:MFS transporter n=1 Tax=Candidatus Villigracilis affinis TaxID=3140682 RepID=UPI0031EB5B45
MFCSCFSSSILRISCPRPSIRSTTCASSTSTTTISASAPPCITFTVLIGSTQFRRIAHRYGNKLVTAWGAAGMAIYPLLLAFSENTWQFYGLSFIGGFLFAMINGAYINYMLEKIPPNDRPSHLAWYSIILNTAILTGSLIAPAIADMAGLVNALILIGILRILAGLSVHKWG